MTDTGLSICVFGSKMLSLLLDVSVTRRLSEIAVPSDTQSDYGRLFENFIAMELKAWHDYNIRKGLQIQDPGM